MSGFAQRLLRSEAAARLGAQALCLGGIAARLLAQLGGAPLLPRLLGARLLGGAHLPTRGLRRGAFPSAARGRTGLTGDRTQAATGSACALRCATGSAAITSATAAVSFFA